MKTAMTFLVNSFSLQMRILVGSNPTKKNHVLLLPRRGEIGRHKGLKIPRWRHRTGSSPVAGTTNAISI